MFRYLTYKEYVLDKWGDTLSPHTCKDELSSEAAILAYFVRGAFQDFHEKFGEDYVERKFLDLFYMLKGMGLISEEFLSISSTEDLTTIQLFERPRPKKSG